MKYDNIMMLLDFIVTKKQRFPIVFIEISNYITEK